MFKQVSGVYFWKIIGVCVAFLSQLLLARLLPVSDYGALVYMLTWLGFLVVLAKFGFDNTCMRYVATYTGRKEWRKLLGLLITAFVVIVIISLLILCLVSMLGAQWLSEFEEYIHLLPWLLPLIPLVALQSLIMSVLRGLQVQLIAQFLEGVFRSVLLIILVLLAWWRTSNFHAGSALDQYVIATAATVLFGIALVYLKRPADLILNRPEFRSREWMSTSTALLFTGGMHLLHSQADILVLGAMRPPNEVAHYGVASRISGLLAMGLGAVTVIVAPKMAEMHGHNESRDKFQSYLRDATRLLMIFTLGLGGILTLIGIPILSLFGEEYIVAYWPLVVLIVGRAIDAGAGPTGQLMAMTGRHWQVSIIVLLSAMVNLAMNVLLIPPLGAMGAAIATAISFFIWNIALLIYAWRQLGLNPSILPNYFVKEFD